MDTIGVTEARDRLSDLLSRVRYGGERIALGRHGKVQAVLVSVDDAELLERMEDELDIAEAREVLERVRSGKERAIPLSEVKDRLGLAQ